MSASTAAVAPRAAISGSHHPGRAVAALAIFESRRLLLDPLLIVGLAFSAFIVFGTGWAADSRYFLFTTESLFPLAAMALLCLNLASLRALRHGAAELFDTQPVPRSARTAALLAARVVPALLGALLLGAGYVVEHAGSGLALTAPGYGEAARGVLRTLHHQHATPSFPELAEGPLAVLLAGALGVALARWIPRPSLAPLWLFLFLAGEFTLVSWNFTERPVHWFMPLTDAAVATRGAEWPCAVGTPCGLDRFAPGSAWWHLLYLAGLLAAVAVAALLRDRSARGLTALGVAGLIVAALAGVLQVP